MERVPKSEDVGVWVLSVDALPSFIDHEPEIMKTEDVMLASYHLAQHIRLQAKSG